MINDSFTLSGEKQNLLQRHHALRGIKSKDSEGSEGG